MSSRVPGSPWIPVVAVVLAPAVFAEPTIAQPAEGNRAEAARSLRRYLDLAPDGQYADSVADTLKQIGQ